MSRFTEAKSTEKDDDRGDQFKKNLCNDGSGGLAWQAHKQIQ